MGWRKMVGGKTLGGSIPESIEHFALGRLASRVYYLGVQMFVQCLCKIMLRSRVVLNCTLQVILHFSSLLSALVRLANSTFEIVSDIQRQRWYVSHHLSLSTLYSTLPRSFQGLIDRLAIQSVQDAITHMVYITSILHVAHKCHHSMSDLLSVASSTTSSKRSSSQ